MSEQVDQAITETPPAEVTEQPIVETPIVETPEDIVEEEPAEKKSGFEKRVEKLNTKARIAEQEAAYWKELALKNSQQPTKQPVSNEPTAQQFINPQNGQIDIDSYTNAKIEYRLQQTFATQQQHTIQQQVGAREAEFIKTHPDYREAIDDIMPEFTQPMAETLLHSEVGPNMAYYLYQHQDELTRIKNLPPSRQFLELGKIEDKVSQPTKTTKLAPAPVTPVKGATPNNQSDKSVDDMTAQEYNAYCVREMRAKRLKR